MFLKMPGRIGIALLIALALACDRQPSSAAPAGAGPTAADLAAGKLGGLYVRQQMVSMLFNGRMTFNLQREFYYFFPDGHVIYGIPSGEIKEHPTAEDFGKVKGVPADAIGTYAVKGGEITFMRDKGQPSTEPFSIPKAGDDSVLQIGAKSVVGSVKAVPFADGQKLDGAYQYDGTVGLGGDQTVFNVKTLTFKPDGALVSDQLTGLDTKGVDTKVGNSGVTTKNNNTGGGTYKFSGYWLETMVGGKTEKFQAFRWAGDDKADAPGMICLDGRVYSRQGAKK